jgi:hypothetical protein
MQCGVKPTGYPGCPKNNFMRNLNNMLVFNPEDKTWKCENPSDEEVKELLAIGKAAVVRGFSTQFINNLINAAAADAGDEPEEPVYDPKLN